MFDDLPKLALLLPALAFACSSPDGSAESRGHEMLVQGAGKLGGCGIGELDERSGGPEIACVGSDGRVHVCRRDGGGWVAEVVDEVAGEQIQLALGPVGPKGLAALVTVGMEQGGEDDGGKGIAWMLWREQGLWQRRVLLRDSALLHAAAVGDVDPRAAGNEVVLAGFTRQLHLVTLGPAGPESRVIGSLPGNAKGLALGLGGILVACDDGSLVRFERFATGSADETWEREVLVRHEQPLARLTAQEDRALYCGNDGALRLWKDDASVELYRSSDRLRGAVFVGGGRSDGGSVWAFASAGYDHTVRLHPELPSQGGVTALADTDKLHHLASGEIDGEQVLVSCGYSGNLVLIRPF